MDHGATVRILLLLGAIVLAGCAGDHLAPVSDRGPGPGGGEQSHYQVRSGDTLQAIAWNHGLDYRDLADWNDLDSPDRIRVGQRLQLQAPSGREDTSPQPPSSPPPAAPAPEQPAASPPIASNEPGERPTGDGPEQWLWPTEGDVVKEFARDADGKQGINIDGELGQPVRAAAGGHVVYSGSGLVGYGNLVILKHRGEFLTAYGYNRRLLVEEGDEVAAGDRIAEMGNGAGNDRPRLHFELRRQGQPVDPLEYLP
ncbi:peptidoglycan DD-metalloendopeptidase family protein [Aquisalimonas sp.]|uniref:peptidoglycan DD-metalloendopeptidase family protein n=1 Tax=Aquisalimonas sp. TaxID=1872621 RepID=UPI0025C08C03|nr:peptidoglycan DD-metalloendopeptidase family protein [Aquisalimonas sp.]